LYNNKITGGGNERDMKAGCHTLTWADHYDDYIPIFNGIAGFGKEIKIRF